MTRTAPAAEAVPAVSAAVSNAASAVEAAADAVASAVTSTVTDAVQEADAVKTDAVSRFKRELTGLEHNARAAAKKRLAGTRVEQIIEKLPGQIEGEVDALLDRVGLVRKARLAVVREEATITAEAGVAASAGAANDVVDAAPAKKKKRA